MELTTDYIIESNTMIAKFLGNDTDEYGENVYVPKELLPSKSSDSFQGIFGFQELEFHSSWTWLMLVVDKIETLFGNSVDVNILLNGTVIYDYSKHIGYVNNVSQISFDYKIEHTYDAVVKFIKYYNASLK